MNKLERLTIETMRRTGLEAMRKLQPERKWWPFAALPKQNRAAWLALAKWHLSEMRKRKV